MRVELITIILLVGSAHAVAAEPIDLPQAIDYALAQNKALVRSALSIDSGAFGVNNAEAEFQVRVRPGITSIVSEQRRSFDYGLRASKKLMWGTELMGVSSPPIVVSNPSINRNPSKRFARSSFLSDTPVSEPTMIIAVTLFRTALKTTVISP